MGFGGLKVAVCVFLHFTTAAILNDVVIALCNPLHARAPLSPLELVSVSSSTQGSAEGVIQTAAVILCRLNHVCTKKWQKNGWKDSFPAFCHPTFVNARLFGVASIRKHWRPLQRVFVYPYPNVGEGGGVVTGVGLMSLFCHLTSREKKQVLTRLSTSPWLSWEGAFSANHRVPHHSHSHLQTHVHTYTHTHLKPRHTTWGIPTACRGRR